MVKCFCDKCGNEIETISLMVPMFVRDGAGTKLMFLKNNILCEKCAEKFNMVKDNLEHEEDFFDMSNEDISLMEYDFKVGDKVVTSTGQIGAITNICNCDRCKERGFYEPDVLTTNGVDKIYITDNDKRTKFRSFYSIGKYKFGNLDKDCVKRDIENETNRIEESTSRLIEYNRQLVRLNYLESVDRVENDEVKISF